MDIYIYMDGYIDEWIDIWMMDEWIDRWIGRWYNYAMSLCIYHSSIYLSTHNNIFHRSLHELTSCVARDVLILILIT